MDIEIAALPPGGVYAGAKLVSTVALNYPLALVSLGLLGRMCHFCQGQNSRFR
ncbi:hypothetical protein [Ralstonia pickettii]|uniref:hypothetical protein n=1 Tax=Ralstonia pickettii TaxID=329 RepID=UPI000A58FC50|nr:hypothetical protein [Ralstonia pickettii]